ncbi:hypothetical protein F2Q69_00020194 [Brassica cretica]|uniref:Uncharacterized protein n=1 Tax=Brassica cretica TaxID=69181 RepID=A0A8S9Q4W6_BRACR|nr:hypothetical protein F2Q69_00020194 [Brassica cretica]
MRKLDLLQWVTYVARKIYLSVDVALTETRRAQMTLLRKEATGLIVASVRPSATRDFNESLSPNP